MGGKIALLRIRIHNVGEVQEFDDCRAWETPEAVRR